VVLKLVAMGCNGCNEKRKGIDNEFKEEIAKQIEKALFDFTSNEYDVLLLGCGSLIIFFKTEIGESEMLLKLTPDNGYISAVGHVYHPTKEEVEFKMKILVPEDGNFTLDESSIQKIEGKYVDSSGRVFELS